jgi:predicted DNA-binding ribbon-helix-helix protein
MISTPDIVTGRDRVAPARPGDMKFRVLRLGLARKAFRLETPVWQALEIIARKNGRTLEDEVRCKLDSVPEGANQSSALRVGAIEDMIAFWQVAESRASRLSWTHVLEASPSAAFALTESRRIICANAALVKAVRGHRLAAETGPTEIAVELPAQAVEEALRSGGHVLTTALFRSGPFRFSARTRLAGHADGSGADRVVIGFLEASASAQA